MKITICGSMVFYAEMKEIQSQLKEKGHEILIPLLDNELPPELGGGRTLAFGKYIEERGGTDAFRADDPLWDFKAAAINDHFEKVQWADAILVVNYIKRRVEGYIGGNTLMEMALAFYLKKPIYMLNQVSGELLYKQEVMGMKPVFLDGDLSKIQ